jgi:hypothetical protein
VFALYLAAAVVVTWPLAAHLNTQLVGHPFSDTTEYARHIWWMHQALRAGTLDLFSPDPLLLYPEGLTSAWLWTAPLQSFPQWLLLYLLPLPVAHNLTALVTLALNGLAMWALLQWLLHRPFSAKQPHPQPLQVQPHPQPLSILERGAVSGAPLPLSDSERGLGGEVSLDETGGEVSPGEARGATAIAAFIGGLVFAFYPAFQGQLGAGHTGLLVLWPVPLYILALLRAAAGDRPRWAWIIGAGALFAASQWGNLLLLLYIVLPFTALFLLCLLWKRRWRDLGRALATLVIGALLSLPFALPTLADVTGGAVARESGVVDFSASLLTVAAPSFYNPLYSGFEFNRRILGQDPFEGAGYVGIVAAALALIAVLRVRRTRFWLLLALLAWVASLGPILKILNTPVTVSADGYTTTVSLPWALLQNLPILNIARTPVRFNFTVGLAVAVLAGYGAAVLGGWLARRTSPRAARAALSGLALLLLLDFQWFLPVPTIPAEVPAAVRELGQDESIRAVFDVPWQHLLTDKDALYLQTGHGLPLVGGHITRRTPLDPAKGYLLQETLDPYLLNAAGVDVIIQHSEWDDDAPARAAGLTAAFGPPLYTDERIAVWRVTHSDNAMPAFLTVDHLSGAATDEAFLYFFAPEAGQAELTLTLASAQPRALTLSLDDEPLDAAFTRTPFSGETAFTVPLSFEAGFHTLALTLDSPCAAPIDPALACATVTVSGVALEPLP